MGMRFAEPLLCLKIGHSVCGDIAVERHIVRSAVTLPERIGGVAIRGMHRIGHESTVERVKLIVPARA